MSDDALRWAQVVGGFAVLVLGVFLTSGAVELVLAAGGVFVASHGLQKIRQG